MRLTHAGLFALVALSLMLGSRSLALGQTPEPAPVIVGAGDISTCSNDNDEATAALLDGIDGTILTLGDNVYDTGTAAQFTTCYDPTWGRHKARTMPSPGNHDYYTTNATGYYGYFGAAAGDPTKGYYSYDLGEWHVVVINSNDACTVISCAAGSAQEQWLRADLAANPAACTLAYWHHPRFSSSSVHGNQPYMEPIWQALYDYGADVVLAGHVHNYERFARQTPSGLADPAYGIREFVVGTGGKSHYGFGAPQPNSEVRNDDTYGVLKLTLHPSSYDWEFVPEAGETFTDSGSEACHGFPAGDVGGVSSLAELGANSSRAAPDGSTQVWLIAALAAGAAILAFGLAAATRRR